MIFIFDCDNTLFEITRADGSNGCARETQAPWKYAGIIEGREKWTDAQGFECVFLPGVRQRLRQLTSKGHRLHVITHSMDYEMGLAEQPVFHLLQETGLRRYFIKAVAMSGDKAIWADKLAGQEQFVFVDDEDENLDNVGQLENGLCVHPLDFFEAR